MFDAEEVCSRHPEKPFRISSEGGHRKLAGAIRNVTVKGNPVFIYVGRCQQENCKVCDALVKCRVLKQSESNLREAT